MKQLKQHAAKFGSQLSFRNACIGVTGFALANSAFAIDTAAVTTAIEAAESDGLTVGQTVIAAVAALVVISIVIAVVKKI
ncbi:major capsid protein [Pseudomonas sp. CrR25]|nr:major capsid protein [Pseudomonas sp. CrR25]